MEAQRRRAARQHPADVLAHHGANPPPVRRLEASPVVVLDQNVADRDARREAFHTPRPPGSTTTKPTVPPLPAPGGGSDSLGLRAGPRTRSAPLSASPERRRGAGANSTGRQRLAAPRARRATAGVVRLCGDREATIPGAIVQALSPCSSPATEKICAHGRRHRLTAVVFSHVPGGPCCGLPPPGGREGGNRPCGEPHAGSELVHTHGVLVRATAFCEAAVRRRSSVHRTTGASQRHVDPAAIHVAKRQHALSTGAPRSWASECG